MKCRQTSLSIMGARFSKQKILEQLRLDDLRTGDQIRITTANSTYEIRIVAAEFRLAEVGGHLVNLYGNPAHERHSNAAIDVGHEFRWITVTPPQRRREASVRVITTSAVVSIELTPRTRPDWGVRAVSACRRLRLIAGVGRWCSRVRLAPSRPRR